MCIVTFALDEAATIIKSSHLKTRDPTVQVSAAPITYREQRLVLA